MQRDGARGLGYATAGTPPSTPHSARSKKLHAGGVATAPYTRARADPSVTYYSCADVKIVGTTPLNQFTYGHACDRKHQPGSKAYDR